MDQPGRSRLWITPPLYFSSVLMRMALTYADAAGAEPDAIKRSELLDLCMTCWRQAQLLRRCRVPAQPDARRGFFSGY
jgi:hypothetical protein